MRGSSQKRVLVILVVFSLMLPVLANASTGSIETDARESSLFSFDINIAPYSFYIVNWDSVVTTERCFQGINNPNQGILCDLAYTCLCSLRLERCVLGYAEFILDTENGDCMIDDDLCVWEEVEDPGGGGTQPPVPGLNKMACIDVACTE